MTIPLQFYYKRKIDEERPVFLVFFKQQTARFKAGEYRMLTWSMPHSSPNASVMSFVEENG